MLQLTRPDKKIHIAENLSTTVGNLAVIGANRIAAIICTKQSSLSQRGQKLIGLIKIDSEEESRYFLQRPHYLGELSDIKDLATQYLIKKVIIAVDRRDFQKLSDVIEVCQKLKIPYELIGDSYDVLYGQVFKELVKRFSKSFEFSIRRLFDLVFSLGLFILSLPVWSVIALFIKATSSGTVLCSREKIGQYGNIFREYEFRIMPKNLTETNASFSANHHLEHLTGVGGYLRNWGLQKLPRLLNVISGDISIIGPPSECPYFDEKYRRKIPFYENRLKVKPGLMGYSQVEVGYFSAVQNIREMLKYDFYYVDHQNSFRLNLKIFFKTFLVIIRKK